MADQGRGSMTSMELAIQRELAYRRKIAMLQLQPDIDLGDEFPPLQLELQTLCQNPTTGPVSGSGPNFTRTKQLMWARNSDFEQLQHIDDRQICNGWKEVKPPSENTYSNPNSTPNHTSSGMKRPAPPGNPKLIPSKWPRQDDHQTANSSKENLFCNVCQVPCAGPRNYEQHIEGKKHQLKVREAAHGQREASEQIRLWCSLCKIWCMNESSFKQHIEGQRHQKNLRNLQ